MNAESFWMAACHFLVPTAAETGLIVGVAALAQRFIASAQWRRTVWQICTFSLAMLVLCEATGLAPTASEWIGRRTSASQPTSTVPQNVAEPPQAEPSGSLRINDEFRQRVAARMQKGPGDRTRLLLPEGETASSVVQTFEPAGPGDFLGARFAGLESPANPQTGMSALRHELRSEIGDDLSPTFPPAAWLGLVWMVGTIVIMARLCFGCLVFLLFHWRRRLIWDGPFLERVRVLAKQLGIRRPVQLVELPRLAGPVAFGWIWPTIALPKNFLRDFDAAQQDAMLVHELAHLAVCDPAWQCLADLVAAVLWWHPLVWWSRSRLEAALEEAADEASLLVANGPNVLAECLVRLGGRLVQGRPFGLIGIEGNGFRSGLGRRVQRLVTLSGGSWHPPHRLKSRLVKSVGPVALAAFAIFFTAWTSPAHFQKRETMKTLQQTWKRFVATLALATAVNADSGSAFAADSTQPTSAAGRTSAVPSDVAAPKAPPETNVTQPPPSGPVSAIDPRLWQRYGMVPSLGAPARPASTSSATPSGSNRNKVLSQLDRIVLQEVFYDAIPLAEVLRDLSEHSRKMDSEKVGLNFLISNASASETTLDPVTGQPIPSAPAPVDMNNVSIRINLPLRNVRLKDVLDVITKVADRPIHYSVEDYGVVFSPGSPPPPAAPASEPEPSPVFRMDPKLLERYGLLRPGPTFVPAPATTSTQVAQLATNIFVNTTFLPVPSTTSLPNPGSKTAKLETIVLSEVHFDGLPLSEVARFLYEQSRKLDPEKQGLNFIIKPTAPMAPIAQPIIDPTTGHAIRPPLPEPVDPNNIIVRFNLPLRNVRLKDVLDAVIKVADKPLTYSVENYGIVLSLGSTKTVAPHFGGGPLLSPSASHHRYGPASAPPPSEVLEVRTFRVDTNTFLNGLESAFGITVGPSRGSPQFDLERQRIELRLAEKELEETQRKFSVGAAPSEDLEKAKGAVDLLRATDDMDRARIRLRLAERDLQRISKKFENGKASTLEVERAKAAIEILHVEMNALETGLRIPSVTRTSQAPSIRQALRQLFSQLGVKEMAVPGKTTKASVDEMSHEYSDKAVFYNELTGIVMVRATAEDMKIVQAAIETLGGAAPREGRRTVSVLGSVANPRVIELRSDEKMSILEAIAEAGGFKSTANKNKIEVSRRGQRLVFKLEDLTSVTEPDKTFWLEPGDVIHASERVF